MSSRHRSSHHHSAGRPRSTGSAPSSYFSAFSSSPYTEKHRTSSSSAYKRSPRPNLIVRMYEKARKLIRDFLRYARKHPLKVIVPLIAAIMGGGALVGLVKRMGGLEGLGLGNLGGLSGFKGFNVDQMIGAGHGLKRGYDGFSGAGLEGGGYDAMSLAKGAVKIASAFL